MMKISINQSNQYQSIKSISINQINSSPVSGRHHSDELWM